MKKGISLVALVITIIVLIILSTTVILISTQGGITDTAKEAVFKNDVRAFQDELTRDILKKQQEIKIVSKKEIATDIAIVTFEEIKEYVQSFTQEYTDKLAIYQGEIVYLEGVNEEEEIWLIELGIKKYSDGWELVGTDGARYIGTEKEITVPIKIENVEIKKLIRVTTQVEKCNILNGVTTIEEGAFEDCRNLNTVTIPNSVTYIGVAAFNACHSLTNITIPNSVTYIDFAAFQACISLTNIEIPNSVTYIGNGAFDSCINLSSITIPDSVINIGSDIFSGCDSLTNVIVGSYDIKTELSKQIDENIITVNTSIN